MRLLKVDNASFLFAGGVEDTFIPQGKDGLRPLDEYELTQHYLQWRQDLDRAASLGIKTLRWGIPWYRVEPRPGVFDWSWIDKVLDYMINKLGIQPIADLVHYGTPFWLQESFVAPEYPQRVSFYAAEFARRYGHMVHRYTALNEPTVNADFSGRRGEWPPYLKGDDGYTQVLLGIARGMQLTIKAVRAVQPDAEFVAVESMHRYRALNRGAQAEARLAFAKDLLCFDLVSGKVGHEHPLYGFLKEHGASDARLAELKAGGVRQDVLGVNYYPWASFDLLADDDGNVHYANGPDNGFCLSDVLIDTYKHTGMPLMVTETSAPGSVERRAQWMRQTLDAVSDARLYGVPVVGYTWFPIITMIGWEYRDDDKPIAKHLLDLGLWDATFDSDGVLVRHPTPLVALYRQLVKDGMKVPVCRVCRFRLLKWVRGLWWHVRRRLRAKPDCGCDASDL